MGFVDKFNFYNLMEFSAVFTNLIDNIIVAYLSPGADALLELLHHAPSKGKPVLVIFVFEGSFRLVGE